MGKYFYPIVGGLLLIASLFSLYYGIKAYQLGDLPENVEGYAHQSYHFLLVSQEIENPYWAKVYAGAKEAADRENIYIEYKGPVQTDIEEHLRILERGIAERVDGIITQGLNAEAFTPVINKAVEAGIPVITIDTDAPHSKRIAYVGTYNYRAGRQAGQEMIRLTGGTGKVGIVTGSLEATNMIERVQGFKDALAASPNLHIVAVESSNISRIYASEKTDQILRDHPDITALYGTSALDGPGMAEVVKRRGLSGKITILSFDDLEETLAYIKEGVITATVAQNPIRMGSESILLMKKLLEGKAIPTLNLTDTLILRKENLTEDRTTQSMENKSR
ncbi:MAG: sugar-binding protein [Thermicanus sp.]|nr:sugar-binding protein [Thermicanus sp.]